MSELTPAEKEYFESGGLKTEGLIAPVEPVAEETAAATVPEQASAAPPEPAPVVAADPVELGEEEIPAPDGKTKRRVVDSRALKEERKKRQEIEAELAKYRENYSRVDERLKLLSEAVSQPEPVQQTQAEQIPDPEQDIFAYTKYLASEVERLKNAQSDIVAQSTEERQNQAVVSSYKQDAAAFARSKPDFNDAYNYLLQKRGEQLKFMGYSDAEVSQNLYNEEMGLVQRALSLRQSPSAYLYQLSQSMGYAPKAAAPAVAAPAVPAPTAVPSVTAEIDRIKAGQSSSKSLSSGGGSAGEELSLEMLANMPEKEFAAFMSRDGNRERVEQALGRRAA